MDEITLALSGIYAIKNRNSKRVYVGSAVRLSRRWTQHKYLLRAGRHPSRLLQASWLKHGEDAFDFSVLELVEDTSALLAREQFWMDELRSTNPKTGFNLALLAGSMLGFKHSKQSRQKMREAKLGTRRNFSPAHRANLSKSQAGKPKPLHSEKTKARMRKSQQRRRRKYGWQYSFRF